MPDESQSASTANPDGAGTTESEATTDAPADQGTDTANASSGGQNATKVEKLTEADYDAAFDKFLGPDAVDLDAADTKVDTAESSEAEPPKDTGEQGSPTDAVTLTEQQTTLLKRSHVTPEMMESWTAEQQAEFIENLEKREADQAREFQRLKDEALAAKKVGENDDAPDSANREGTDENAETQPTGNAGSFAADAKKLVDDAVDNYGDEIKPLAEMTVKMGQRLDEQSATIESLQSSSALKDQLLVEMTIDAGIAALRSDFPSLDKAEAREKVEARFKGDWKNEGNPHRTGKGPLLSRVRDALRDAAKAEFGTNTESAAQVTLVNKTKDRLKNQPDAGSGRGKRKPKTQEDVYDNAFDEYLKDD